ncbi:MAG: hypothetical protein UV24_C0001G0034 [Candidatus Nomurabacteria bacterium GW2011_GWA2_42_41]|nr:MAG: hypothetical protein UV24_C0001G0034 [Candidatus Nomurabacteria bacterium GW2011_GWA2_42_41]
MAISIFAIPAIILSLAVSGLGSSGSGETITTVARWMFLVMVTTVVIYFAGAILWKHRAKGRLAVSGAKKLFESKDDESKGFVGRWWAKHDDEGKRFIWYVVVITVAYLASYLAPDGKEAVFRGVVALIGAHIIWTFLSSGKISAFTWTIVLGMVTYFVLAWGYPKDAPRIFDASWGLSKKVMTDIADTAQSINENYGKTASETKKESEATVPRATNVVHVQRLAQVETVFELTPDFNRRNMIRTPPMKTITYYCSDEGSEMAIVYSAGQINVPSGQAFKCPTLKDDIHALIGVDIRNASLMFRSNKPGATATVIW